MMTLLLIVHLAPAAVVLVALLADPEIPNPKSSILNPQ